MAYKITRKYEPKVKEGNEDDEVNEKDNATFTAHIGSRYLCLIMCKLL